MPYSPMLRGSSRIRPLGYKYCFIDEGYQYARGEYATPDAYLFPQGVGYVGHQVDNEGPRSDCG